jgi:hypothetical protein
MHLRVVWEVWGVFPNTSLPSQLFSTLTDLKKLSATTRTTRKGTFELKTRNVQVRGEVSNGMF